MDPIIILAIILVLVVIICLWKAKCAKKEGLFPWKDLTHTPGATRTRGKYFQPWCSDRFGRPVPCKVPCQYWNPACQYSFPVPVMSRWAGAYDPSTFCPGPPVC